MNDTNVCDVEDSLTAAQFEKLLRHLHPDRECAAEKYELIRLKLTRFFEWNRCFPAEDLVDETLDRVARRLAEIEIGDVSAYAWGVARHVRQEALRNAAKTVPISDAPEAEPFVTPAQAEERIHEEMEHERRRNCLHESLLQLSRDDRTLFLAYYRPEKNIAQARHQLADRLGITPGALRVRLNRLRERVEKIATSIMASKEAKSQVRAVVGSY